MQKLKELKNKKGFTLIEMLIVILIVVILIAIAVPAVAGYRRDAQRTQDEGAIETIRTSIESALIRVRPSDNDTSGFDAYTTGILDYDAIVAISEDTSGTYDADTKEFFGYLADYLGPNFQGNFQFRYIFGSSYSTGSTAMYLYWLTYWPNENVTSDDAVMLYHNNFQNTNTALRTPAYLSEALDKLHAHDPSDSFTDAQLDAYRP